MATPLAMVLTEVLQNAVEHGFKEDDGTQRKGTGVITLTARRASDRLHVVVDDDGDGLPESFDLAGSTSLGLSIVRTLVELELDGKLEIRNRRTGGTRVTLDLPVRR
jgi:two-component sensor histidine kinase